MTREEQTELFFLLSDIHNCLKFVKSRDDEISQINLAIAKDRTEKAFQKIKWQNKRL